MPTRIKTLATAVLVMVALPFLGTSPPADAAASSDIVGSIVDEATGLPIPGLMVMAWSQPIAEVEHVATGVSDATGHFDLGELFPKSSGGVTPGRYVIATGNGVELQFSPYAIEYWDDKPSFAAADLVVVADGEVVTVDFELALGGTISGTVTDELTGLPIPEIGVSYTHKTPELTPSLMEAGRTDE